MSKISLQDLGKTFPDGTRALTGVNLEIENGEFVVLVGPSGCGKTTLLRLLAGLEEPTTGMVRIDGKDALTIPSKDRDLGLVFQNYALFPNLNVFENIAFSLKARKIKKEIIREKVAPIAEKLALADFLQKKPGELSGGQRQRVALGRLLARNPGIHLLDEPLSNLDANLRNSMRNQLAQLHEEHKKTTLFVTHDQVEAMTLGQRLCVMNQGKIIQVAPPSEIYNNPKNRFVAQFFGSPSINLFQGKIEKRENLVYFSNQQFSLSLPDKPLPETKEIELGVRPENWQIQSNSSSQSIRAKLKRIENLGDAQILYFKFLDTEIILKSSKHDFQTGQTHNLTPDWERVHWFHTSTGERILGQG